MLGLAFQTADGSNVGFVDDEYKMVLVVRNDLKMGKGKMAAQVSFNLLMVVVMELLCDRVLPPCIFLH